MLVIDDLYASYGNVEALHGITLNVQEGEIVALLGANGAGKTSTLMSIMRLAPPDAPKLTHGKITFQGNDLATEQPHKVVSQYGMTLVPEGRRIFGNLTVAENLKLATYSRKDHGKIESDYNRVFKLFPRLSDRKNQMSGTLSGGEQQMLAVGRALMSNVQFILLDEPSMGLAPLLMKEMFQVLKQLNQEGMTILIVEQNAHIALQYAHRAYVLETGKVVLEGSAKELAQNNEIQKAYLGA